MPEHPGVLTRVAMHQHRLKRYGDAIANLREAIASGGRTDAEFLLSLALYCRNEGSDRRNALEVVRRFQVGATLFIAGTPATLPSNGYLSSGRHRTPRIS